MRLIRRILTCAFCLIFSCSAVLADGVHFALTADIDPVQWNEDIRPLMEGLADLADAASIEGVWQAENGRFSLETALLLPHRGELQQTDLHVSGIDSHWQITSPLLGDTVLILNNLALAEFGVKSWNHLGLPLQYAALAVPYTHTSALAVLRPELTVLFPDEAGTTVLSPTEVQALASRIAALAEEDRTLRYWIEALGIATGSDQFIFEALHALPEALAVLCPEGLAIVKDEQGLRWLPNHSSEVSENVLPLLELLHDGPATTLTLSLPGLGTAVMSLRDDVTILTGTLHTESPLLTGEIAFSLPAQLPVTLPFFLTVDAEGLLLGEEPLHLVFEGEAHGSTLTIRQLLPDHTRTMMTLTAVLTPIETSPLPAWTAEDISGVNILSATGESLAALMRDVRGTLLPGTFRLIATLPARTCQAMMDVLEDSGILGLLTDAMQNGFDGY